VAYDGLTDPDANSNGTHASVTSDLQVTCVSANSTHFNLVMNMHDTVVKYDNDGIVAKKFPRKLGEDVSFTQSATGEISDIKVSKKDSEYVVQVKIGAINAFQTSIQPGSEYSSAENDVVGVHTSTFRSIEKENVTEITKTFSQTDVSTFADPTLVSKNVQLQASGVVHMNQDGKVQFASFEQTATLVGIDEESSTQDEDTSGFDSQLRSRGTVELSLMSSALAESISSPPADINKYADLLDVTRATVVTTPPSELLLDAASAYQSMSTSSVLEGSDYPFNKTWSEAKKIGGKMVSADLSANVIVGTNLGACNSDTFNYVASADASGTVTLFGSKFQAFHTSANYGKDHGSALSDEIEATVFGKQVFEKSFSPVDVDCSEHTQTIPVQKHPGVNVSHTLWVGPVPVTFAASATLDFAVTWGWHICDTDLSADLWIKPAATLNVAGSAKLNLLVIDAATDISLSANTALQPQAHVSGTVCDAGVELDLVSSGDNADIHSYYDKKKCKLLFFDCHMEKAGDKTWWSWSEPAQTKVLANKTMSIPV